MVPSAASNTAFRKEGEGLLVLLRALLLSAQALSGRPAMGC